MNLVLWTAFAFFVDYAIGGFAGASSGKSADLGNAFAMLVMAALFGAAIGAQVLIARRKGSKISLKSSLAKTVYATVGRFPAALLIVLSIAFLGLVVSAVFMPIAPTPGSTVSELAVRLCIGLWMGEGAIACVFALRRKGSR